VLGRSDNAAHDPLHLGIRQISDLLAAVEVRGSFLKVFPCRLTAPAPKIEDRLVANLDVGDLPADPSPAAGAAAAAEGRRHCYGLGGGGGSSSSARTMSSRPKARASSASI